MIGLGYMLGGGVESGGSGMKEEMKVGGVDGIGEVGKKGVGEVVKEGYDVKKVRLGGE